MSEKVTKKPAVEEGTEATGAAKKPATKPAKADKDKKENWFKRTGKKVKNGMANHPFWTAFGGAAIGSGLTVGAGVVGKKLINKRRERNAYISQEDNFDPNV